MSYLIGLCRDLKNLGELGPVPWDGARLTPANVPKWVRLNLIAGGQPTTVRAHLRRSTGKKLGPYVPPFKVIEIESKAGQSGIMTS